MTEKTLTTENIRPALDALRGELAPWPVVAKKQDRLNTAQLNAANSGITSSLVAQIIANTAAIRALESAITGTGLRALVVASLPAVGTTGILYIVPVTTYDPDTDADVVNYSNEYLWIPVEGGQDSEGHYEQVGQTGIVINNGQLTITVNGTSVGTFTANQSGDTTAAITVPTNADYVDRTTDQTVAGKKTWTGEQSFTLPIVGSITGTAAKAIADEDGTSIKTGYGKLAGNQTWTGTNTYTGAIRFNNSAFVSGTPSANVFYTSLQWGGFVNNSWTAPFTINNAIRTNGYSDTSFRTYSQSSNTLTGFVHETNADASDISFRPIVNGTHKLGSSSYQWSSVYAQSYYYNGTAWGLDKANTWTNITTFSIAAESIVVKHTTYKGAILFRTNGTSNFKNYNTFLKWDINGYDNSLGLYRSVGVLGDTTTGATDEDIDTSFSLWKAHIRSKSLDFTNSVKATNDGTENSLKPITTSVTDLGTSTSKWKSLNGINPGALSLPDYAAIVDISGSIVPPEGETSINLNGGDNYYVPTVNGWIGIRYDGATMIQIYRNAYNCPGVTATHSTGTKLVVTMPVLAGITYIIKIVAVATGTARYQFYPCLGNV